MRGWTIGMWLGLLLAGAGAAQACSNCTVWNGCATSSYGALICLSNDWACWQAGRCTISTVSEDAAAAVAVTLLEDAGGTAGPAARVVPLAGELAVGRGAARVAGRALGGAPADGDILYTGFGYFDGGTVAFRSPTGDGFTLRREPEGAATRLTVRDLADGRPGRVLARERLGRDDALAVRVTLEGRARLLIVSAASLSAAEDAARKAAAKREVAAIGGARRQAPPPFQMEFVEEAGGR